MAKLTAEELVKEYSKISTSLTKEYMKLFELVKNHGDTTDLELLLDLKNRLTELIMFVDNLN